jgi:hypothetical protein
MTEEAKKFKLLYTILSKLVLKIEKHGIFSKLQTQRSAVIFILSSVFVH